MKFSNIILATSVLFAASFVVAIPNCDAACENSPHGKSVCSNRCALCIPTINAGWISNDGRANDCGSACNNDANCMQHCKDAQTSCCKDSSGCCPRENDTGKVCF